MAEETKNLDVNEIDIDYDAVLEQAKVEVKEARDFVREKRVEFRNRLKLYNNQRKQKDKIGDTSVYNVISSMLAIYYSDELQVAFMGREVGDTVAAANVEMTAKFDYDEMGMDVINYMVQWDRLFFGVGIRQISGWDNKRKVPLPKSLDPLSWLPDPHGYLTMKNFRFMGFEVEYSRKEMSEDAGFFNHNLLQDNAAKTGSEADQTRADYREAQGLSEPEKHPSLNGENTVYDMVDWFMEIKGSDGKIRKYLVTFDDKISNIFRCEEIEPVTAEERKDPTLVPFPIVLNYFSPTRTDPFGTSVCDLVEDKQRAKSVLKNLRIAAAKADLYPMYLYNRDKILNRRDLDFAFNKMIAVRGDVDQGTIMPLNKASSKLGETLNNEQALDSDIEVATGANRNAQGVLSDQQRTLGEVQQTQANQSLRFMLGSRINAWGERRFWRLWYRLYRQNFQGAATKVIRLQSALGSQFASITRKDFITSEDPDIRITSKLEAEQTKLRDRTAFAAVMPIMNADPTKPLAAKRFTERHLLRLYGLPQEQIEIMSPDTPDEVKAKMENELLSKDNIEDVEVDTEKDDHLSHMVIHSQAEKTTATLAHLQAHRTAYFQHGQYEHDRQIRDQLAAPGGTQVNGAANSLQNQNAQMNSGQNMPQSVAPEKRV